MKEFVEKLIERLGEYVRYSVTMEDKRATEFDIQTTLSFCLKEVKEIVKQMAEEYESNLSENLTGWIPCSLRLPEDKHDEYYETVNISLSNGIVTSGCYRNHDNEWWGDISDGSYENITGEVIAWQPLPEPYKPKEKQEEAQPNVYTERFNRVL